MSAPNGTEKSEESHRQLPDPKTLAEAGELPIKDENGNEVAFKTLYADKPAHERQLIIFIRHFFCGSCEEYVRALAGQLPPATLSQTSPPTTLTLIGCGDPVCIADYKTRTHCPFPIYADPSRNLYAKLDMLVTLRQPPKQPDYITMSFFSIVTSSFKNVVMSGLKGLKGGPASQNGGEWLFEGGQLKFVHRMRNTADHSEIKELEQVLGIQG
ncbi:Hypothetical predicted protein [Lecanosticta acicola]|uniref:Thioredoxin-like protein n=1 Tax=Lecanosticta acicola TaxID=111012 RepID=A0AAI9EDT6_9PEZI|nr:Hypothetical predicted protein [Lecanosticta acicola]